MSSGGVTLYAVLNKRTNSTTITPTNIPNVVLPTTSTVSPSMDTSPEVDSDQQFIQLLLMI